MKNLSVWLGCMCALGFLPLTWGFAEPASMVERSSATNCMGLHISFYTFLEHDFAQMSSDAFRAEDRDFLVNESLNDCQKRHGPLEPRVKEDTLRRFENLWEAKGDMKEVYKKDQQQKSPISYKGERKLTTEDLDAALGLYLNNLNSRSLPTKLKQTMTLQADKDRQLFQKILETPNKAGQPIL